jgi:hypothetical protein
MFTFLIPGKASPLSFFIPRNAGIAAVVSMIVIGPEPLPSTGLCNSEDTGRIRVPEKFPEFKDLPVNKQIQFKKEGCNDYMARLF